MLSSSLSASSRHFSQNRYFWCLWGLSTLFPFIVFQLIFLDAARFQFPTSSPINLLSGYLEGLTPISGTPPTQNDVQSGPLVGHDEYARSSPNEWMNTGRSPGVGGWENNGPPNPLERNPKDKEPTFNEIHPTPPPMEIFGLLENSGKEKLLSWEEEEKTIEKEQLISWEEEEKKKPIEKEQLLSWKEEEKTIYIDVMTTDEKDSKATGKDGEDERNYGEDKKKQDDQKSETEDKEPTFEESRPALPPAESFGLAEHKEKEQLRSWEDKEKTTHNDLTRAGEEAAPAAECDLFDGSWVLDSEGPLYTNLTCPYVQDPWNCMKNGRPDTDYLYWKWSPRECDLPRFDAKAFLDSFTGKNIGFLGDSLALSQCVSLLCTLSQVEVSTQIDLSSSAYKTYRWYFEQNQLTLDFVWSPFLLKEEHQGAMGLENGQSVLYLDVLDNAWTSVLAKFDMVVFSTGMWYMEGSVYVKEDKIIGCHRCSELNLTELGFYEPYRQMMRLVLGKVARDFKGVAVMSATAVAHFESGHWRDGGECKREKPLTSGEVDLMVPSLQQFNDMYEIFMNEFNSMITNDTSKLNEDVHFEAMHVTKVAMTRADAHPAVYRTLHPYEGKNESEWIQNDCVHWCLPGPPDTWNQFLVKLVQKYF